MTNVLYDLLFVLPLSILATALGEPYFGGPENGLPLYLITLLITGTCLTVKHWENRLKYLLPGVLLAFASGVILIRDPLEREEFLWSHQWVLWTVLTALVSFFAGRLFAQIRLARRTLGVGLVALLVILQLMWAYPPKIAVACDFLLLSLIIADEFQHFWKKSGYTDAKGHLVSISPFLAVLAILVFLLPAPHDPYDWSFAVRLWQRATDAVKITSKWFHGSDEDYAGIIGFSDKQTFFGKLTKKDKDLLTVTGNRNVGDVVYLAGKVLNSFDGRAWTSTYEDEGRDKMLDTLETLSAVTAYDPDYLRNYVRRLELKIQFGEFNTKYYFLPLKSILAPDHVGDDMIRSVGGDVMTTGKFGYGSTYTITYYRMNQSHTGFQEFLENAKELDEETWEYARNLYEPMDFVWSNMHGETEVYAGSSYEDYLRYKDRMSEAYLPETIVSQAMADYLDQLFEGAETDLEKLARVEELLSTFRYSDHPGELPESVVTPADFLDYFIFEKQEGYCSHYATAFALIARYLGYPARYVQGFYVKKGDEQTVTVKSSMAHAWPEVYLEGIGWLPYEPTPGKKYAAVWAFQVKRDDSGPGATTDHGREFEDEDEPETDDEETQAVVVIQWRVILIPLGLAFAFLLLFLLFDHLMVKRWFKRLSEEGKFIVTCKKSLRALELMGYRLEQGETLEEFALRTGKKVPKNYLRFLGAYELSAYAGKPVDELQRKQAQEDLDNLMERLKTIKGKWYFWYAFQIGRMEAGKKQKSFME